MSEKKQQSYQERLKRMKERVAKDKKVLDSEFPDDVTTIGSPDLLKKTDSEIDDDSKEEKGDGKKK